MRIIDTQQHEQSVWLDWEGTDESVRGKVMTELELAGMNAVGISGVVLNPHARGWAEAAARAMPDRFAVAPNYSRPAIDRATDIDAVIAEERRNPAVVALRIALVTISPRWKTPTHEAAPIHQKVQHDLTEGLAYFEAGRYDPLLAACERERLPVFMLAPRRLDTVKQVAERYPDLTLIVDHLGASAPPVSDADVPPFAVIPSLLELAQYPNVAVKLCGVPALSRESYPYRDVWIELGKVVDAFGAERIMWASDISRIAGRMGFEFSNPYGESAYPGKHTLAQSLFYLLETDELTSTQKEWILGRSAQKLLGWPGD